MFIKSVKYSLLVIAKSFSMAVIFTLILFVGIGLHQMGFTRGFLEGQKDAENYYLDVIEKLGNEGFTDAVITPVVTQTQRRVVLPTKSPTWGGPQLWESVNIRRQELGVNSLQNKEELCTVAAIRLNDLLELGKLDGHEGFSNFQDRRADLKWIFEKYGVVAEFLAYGGQTPQETVSLWENTMGHKKLLTGGEYVWGCIYAQNTFAAAITAY